MKRVCNIECPKIGLTISCEATCETSQQSSLGSNWFIHIKVDPIRPLLKR